MNPAMIDGPVWVTGGAGFIGSHLVDELLGCGLAVTVLDNFSSGDRENLPESDDHLAIKTVDLRDPDGLQRQVKASRPAAVFHLAAHASVPGSIDDPAYDYHSNAVGSFNLLDALRRHGPETVCVLASSGAVYGEPTQFPIAESQPMRPISPYGYSKQSAEQIARMFHDMYGLDVRIARIFNTYGPRMPRFVALDFLKKLDADPRRLEILGSGRQLRDFNYVADTIQGLSIILGRGETGAVYNLASGRSHTVTELADMLLRVKGLGETAFRYTGTSWRGDVQRWEVDITRLSALGYVPRYSLDAGLRELTTWYEHEQGRTAQETM